MVVTTRRRMAPFFFLLAVLQSSRLCFTKLLGKVWKRLGCVCRCGGGLGAQTSPSHSIFPFGYPIQHGQLFDPSFPPFSLILSPVMLSPGYPPLLCYIPP